MLSKKTFLVLIALVAVVILAVAACQQAPATTAPTEPPPAETEVAAPVETAAPVATEAPAAYTPEIRKASQPWKIGYGDGLAGIPFTKSVTDSINDVAKQMGVEIVYCDNAYNQEKTVECSNNLVTQGVRRRHLRQLGSRHRRADLRHLQGRRYPLRRLRRTPPRLCRFRPR